MPKTAIEQFVGENLANEDRPKTTFLLVKPYQESRIRLLVGCWRCGTAWAHAAIW
jgi:hypothetical protein